MVLPMFTTALLLSLACAPATLDDTAGLGWEVEEKTPRLGGLTFDPPVAVVVPMTDRESVDVVVAGRVHVLAHFCDRGLLSSTPEWLADGDVVTVSWVPVSDTPGDHTCTLITPIGRLTIPVVVE